VSALPLLRAQVEAEVKTRLRSLPSAVALVAILLVSFQWIPDPAGNAASITWRMPGNAEVVTSALYTAPYIGMASGLLTALFLSLIGFYLVAGSVRRDRDRGVGAILAATPLSNVAYLGGKIAAHGVYLATMATASLLSGLLVFATYGEGPFQPLAFLIPFLLIAVPAMVFVAALAVVFDVTPGLRGRGGLVAYFFVWAFVLLLLPGKLGGTLGSDRDGEGLPIFDPLGAVMGVQAIAGTVDAEPGSIAMGLAIYDAGIRRIPWPGPDWRLAHAGWRSLNLGWTAALLGLALLFFDRFDPARTGTRGPSRLSAVAERANAAIAAAPSPLGGLATLSQLARPRLEPGTWRAISAEARRIWAEAGLVRWLLPLAAVGASLPGTPARLGAALLFLLLVPVLSEVAAREELAGLRPLIGAQPSIPSSWALWKLAAVLLFLAPLALPRLAASVVAPDGFRQALAFALGILFVALFAVAAGLLTGGGKLFTGLFLCLWYGAFNGMPFLDFCGALSEQPSIRIPAYCVAATLPFFALAFWRERTETP
jgi:hypothetical protein